MRKIVGLILLGTLLAAVSAAPTFAQDQDIPLALVGARIYAAPDGLPIFEGTIVAAGGKVVAVGPRDKVEVPAGARILDCGGRVITAGFQNSHVHFTEEKWIDAAHQPASKLTSQLKAMLTRYGFTTVVDTASSLSNTNALRRRIESGEIAGPRIFTAGEALYPPNGIPFYLKENLPEEIVKLLPQPSTPEQATAIASQHNRDGADLTKLFTGSWVSRGKVLPMPEEIAVAAAAETHRHGKLVFSHASSVAGLEVALRAGVDVLAHALDDTRGLTPEHLRRMKEKNLALVPTLKLFGGDRWLFEILDEVRDYARLGGPILFGTDVGYLTDYDPTTEYVLMASAGLSWREILAALTTNPAARMGEASRRGRIAPGMDADFVVLAQDPVRDVRAFADVRHVIRGGRVIYSATEQKQAN
jgi:imidazolonepropionase-like amidohydrolase